MIGKKDDAEYIDDTKRRTTQKIHNTYKMYVVVFFDVLDVLKG